MNNLYLITLFRGQEEKKELFLVKGGNPEEALNSIQRLFNAYECAVKFEIELLSGTEFPIWLSGHFTRVL